MKLGPAGHDAMIPWLIAGIIVMILIVVVAFIIDPP